MVYTLIGLLRLLQEIAMDANLPIGPDNPLRQVIISTHSPLVVSNVADDALIYVRTTLRGRGHQRGSVALFQWLPETWRERLHVRPEHIVARGDILTYANPVVLDASDEGQHRVIDNPYIHSLLETSQPEKDA